MRRSNVGTKSSKFATTTKTIGSWKNVSKNISTTPYNTFRVRVCGDSVMCKTKKAAYATRKELYLKHGKA